MIHGIGEEEVGQRAVENQRERSDAACKCKAERVTEAEARCRWR